MEYISSTMPIYEPKLLPIKNFSSFTALTNLKSQIALVAYSPKSVLVSLVNFHMFHNAESSVVSRQSSLFANTPKDERNPTLHPPVFDPLIVLTYLSYFRRIFVVLKCLASGLYGRGWLCRCRAWWRSPRQLALISAGLRGSCFRGCQSRWFINFFLDGLGFI